MREVRQEDLNTQEWETQLWLSTISKKYLQCLNYGNIVWQYSTAEDFQSLERKQEEWQAEDRISFLRKFLLNISFPSNFVEWDWEIISRISQGCLVTVSALQKACAKRKKQGFAMLRTQWLRCRRGSVLMLNPFLTTHFASLGEVTFTEVTCSAEPKQNAI